MTNGGCAPGSGRLVGAYIRIRYRTGVDPNRKFRILPCRSERYCNKTFPGCVLKWSEDAGLTGVSGWILAKYVVYASYTFSRCAGMGDSSCIEQ